MKFAIISDIHANYPTLLDVYNDIRSEGISQIYCLGDLVGYYPQIDEVIDFVIEKNIITILGNYDKACICNTYDEGLLYLKKGISEERKKIYGWTRNHLSDKAKDFLAGLPQKIELHFDAKKMLLVHGSPANISNYIFPDTSRFYMESLLNENMIDYLVCGHTHVPMIIELPDGMIVNPGSVGVPKDGKPEASYLIVDFKEKHPFTIKRVPSDKEYIKLLADKLIYSTFSE